MINNDPIKHLADIYASLPNDNVRKTFEQFSQAYANLMIWFNILKHALPDELEIHKGLVHTTGKELKKDATNAAIRYADKYKEFVDSFIEKEN